MCCRFRSAGRPADYRGAVGTYHIATVANPTNVKAGDPIDLLDWHLRHRADGIGRRRRRWPSCLTLTDDFKVPNEPLAGFVKDDANYSRRTIRPRKAGITQIPAIPFSYFDPATENSSQSTAIRFLSTSSRPIRSHFRRGRSQQNCRRRSQCLPIGRRSRSIATAGDLHWQRSLTNQSPPTSISRQLAVLLAIGPLAVLGLLLYRSRRGFAALTGRFGSSLRRFQSQLAESDHPADVAVALRILLAKRFRLSRSQADAITIVGALRSQGHRNLAVRCERILDQCDAPAEFSGLPLSELKRNALQFVDDLQTESRRPRPQTTRLARGARAIRVTAAPLLAATLLLNAANARAATEPVVTPSLTPDQQQSLLTEANERYNLALSNVANDSAEAKQAFADAAEKYQLLVDNGVQNSRLFFNTANAYLESGDTARAIANYHRSLRLDPTNRDARTNLAYAESLCRRPPPPIPATRPCRSPRTHRSPTTGSTVT